MAFLRYVMSLSLVAWVGGILFFCFDDADFVFCAAIAAFGGSVVSPALNRLHWIGIVSGILFLVSSLLFSRFSTGDFRPFAAAHILVAIMLALTCISQFTLSPKLAAIRAETARDGFRTGRSSRAV